MALWWDLPLYIPKGGFGDTVGNEGCGQPTYKQAVLIILVPLPGALSANAVHFRLQYRAGANTVRSPWRDTRYRPARWSV